MGREFKGCVSSCLSMSLDITNWNWSNLTMQKELSDIPVADFALTIASQ